MYGNRNNVGGRTGEQYGRNINRDADPRYPGSFWGNDGYLYDYNGNPLLDNNGPVHMNDQRNVNPNNAGGFDPRLMAGNNTGGLNRGKIMYPDNNQGPSRHMGGQKNEYNQSNRFAHKNTKVVEQNVNTYNHNVHLPDKYVCGNSGKTNFNLIETIKNMPEQKFGIENLVDVSRIMSKGTSIAFQTKIEYFYTGDLNILEFKSDLRTNLFNSAACAHGVASGKYSEDLADIMDMAKTEAHIKDAVDYVDTSISEYAVSNVEIIPSVTLSKITEKVVVIVFLDKDLDMELSGSEISLSKYMELPKESILFGLMTRYRGKLLVVTENNSVEVFGNKVRRVK